MERDPKNEDAGLDGSYGIYPLTLPHTPDFKRKIDQEGTPVLAWNQSISVDPPALLLISCAALGKSLNLSEPLVPSTVKCRWACL